MNRRRRFAVIGGGITGLSAAYQLYKLALAAGEPIDCHLYEASDRLGGKILTYREQGLTLEAGPDSMLRRKPAGMGLIRDLGMESEIVDQSLAANKTYIVKEGNLIPMPKGTNMGIPVQFQPFFETNLLSPSAKARVFSDLILPRREETSDESLGGFLRRRFGDELVNSLCEPLLAGIYSGKIDDLSLAATFPQFGLLEQNHRSVILGLRRAASKSAGSVPETGRSAFITLRRGLASLTDRLAEVLAPEATFHLESPVSSISKHDRRYAFAGDASLDCLYDGVVVTTPSEPAAKLIQPFAPHWHWIHSIPAVSTATVILGFRSNQIDVQLDASGFVIPRSENRGITASTFVSSKWPHTTTEDYVLVRCYVGRSGQEQYLELSDEQMLQLVRNELQSLVGIQVPPVFSKITRWNDAMPQYHVGHLDRINTVETELKSNAPGLVLAGAPYHGVGIPDCIQQGQNAANEVWLTSHL
ncbi:MAG: protoporphyrinogen oxidase [Alicyclobacillaceae bacterium]|nr:protoporphyrinogen oxidase [Alicyclobacillaceae bacterium]